MRDSATPSGVEGPSFAGQKVLVLGAKVTGRDVALVLAERGATVLVSDSGDVSSEDLVVLTDAGIDVENRSHDRARADLGRFDFVVPSPGISPFSGFLAEIVATDTPVVSELDLGGQIANVPVVAVTGTNGKTTVVHLAEAMGQQGGLDVFACGNLETKFITAAHERPGVDAFVVEASSFALAFCTQFHPRVAIVTSFAPDHLDWHRTIEHYRTSKAKIAQQQTRDDLFLYPVAQPELADLAPSDGPRRVPFGDVLPPGAEVLAERGPHFGANAAGAAAAMAFLGVREEAMEAAMRSFSFDRHRLEPVGTKDGVRFVDDSIATNTQATIAALRTFRGARRPDRRRTQQGPRPRSAGVGGRTATSRGHAR